VKIVLYADPQKYKAQLSSLQSTGPKPEPPSVVVKKKKKKERNNHIQT